MRSMAFLCMCFKAHPARDLSASCGSTWAVSSKRPPGWISPRTARHLEVLTCLNFLVWLGLRAGGSDFVRISLDFSRILKVFHLYSISIC